MGIVQEHIERFLRYQSHYSRQDNPHREYLSPSLSLATMYKDECTEQVKPAVSEWKYRQIFNTKYNLAFGRYVYVITPFGVVLLIYRNTTTKGVIKCLLPLIGRWNGASNCLSK